MSVEQDPGREVERVGVEASVAPTGDAGLAVRWRQVRRGLGLAGSIFGFFGIWLVGVPVAVLAGRRLHWRDWILHSWGRTAVRTLGIRVTSSGTPPRNGTLLVSNHLSYVDIIVLASRLPCVFLSKAEVASWPVLGWMTRAVGVLFVKREDKRALPAVVETLSRELSAGHTVVLFPEGTSSRGSEVLPFRASLLAPAASGGFPVAHASLSYRIPEGSGPASERVCWWGDMTFADHLLGLLTLPHIDAQVRFGTESVRDSDRKALARRLWEAVQAQFDPVH